MKSPNLKTISLQKLVKTKGHIIHIKNIHINILTLYGNLDRT